MSLVKAALRELELDLLLRRVSLVNVLTGETYPADIGIFEGKVACVEPPGTLHRARTVVEGEGLLAVPGLIDAHMHIESSLVTPAHFAQAVLPHGTTAVAADPHEIANVLGLRGVRLMWEASRGLPLKVYFLVPTCVPSAPGLETSGGEIGPAEVEEMLGWEGVLGLAEVMDARAVVEGQEKLSAILAVGKARGVVIEGHNPFLRGRELNAYVAAGIDSDHTLMTPELLLEKLRLGVTVELQQRYLSSELIAALEGLPLEADFLLVTDDVSPDHLWERGHLDEVLRQAIRLGMEPMRALRAATLKPARRLRLYDQGVIAPGKAADIVLVRDLASFAVEAVLVDGRMVVREGELLWKPEGPEPLLGARGSVKLPPLKPEDFEIEAPIREGDVRVRAILLDPAKPSPGQAVVTVRVEEGRLRPDDPDLTLIAVFHRHGRSESRALGLIKGLGLREGAVASTYAHDAHNLLVVGKDGAEMAAAANALIEADGGLAVSRGGRLLSLVELPLAGLMSLRPVPEVAQAVDRFNRALMELGIRHPDALMRLATLTLPVSSGLRITDRGLVDAEARRLVDFFRGS